MTDKTTYASEMNVELSTLPPFTKVSTLIINGEEILAKDFNEVDKDEIDNFIKEVENFFLILFLFKIDLLVIDTP